MKKTIAFAAALGTVLALGLAGPANAETDDVVGGSDQGWYAVNRATGDVFIPGETSIWDSEPTTEVGPMLLDPVDWAQCHTFNNAGWVIIDYPFWWDGVQKTMKLECGTSTTSGWFHIRDGKMDQWKGRITQATPDANTDAWDDLMWWGATGSLDSAYSSSGPTNGKVCMTARIDMYNTNTQALVYTFYPTYSWSITNDRLVTAIPSTNPGC